MQLFDVITSKLISRISILSFYFSIGLADSRVLETAVGKVRYPQIEVNTNCCKIYRYMKPDWFFNVKRGVILSEQLSNRLDSCVEGLIRNGFHFEFTYLLCTLLDTIAFYSSHLPYFVLSTHTFYVFYVFKKSNDILQSY